MGSNQLNQAIADAYLKADLAVDRYTTYNKQQDLIEDFELLQAEALEHQQDEIERAGDFNFWGSVIGSAIGFFAGGGVPGAMVGWNVGGGVGQAVADWTDDEAGLVALQTEIKDFDWELDKMGHKYDALRKEEWQDKMDDAADKTYEALDTWREDYYDPWYEDLVLDVGLPIGEAFISGSAQSAWANMKAPGTAWSKVTAWKGFQNMSNINKKSGTNWKKDYWDEDTKSFIWGND